MRIIKDTTEKEITCNNCNSVLSVNDNDIQTFKWANELMQQYYESHIKRIQSGLVSQFKIGPLPYTKIECTPFYWCAVCDNEIPAALPIYLQKAIKEELNTIYKNEAAPMQFVTKQ